MMKCLCKKINLHHSRYCRGIFLVLVLALLAACDAVPTETLPNGDGSNIVVAYTGPSCATTDACTFKVEFWDKMAPYQCKNCHNSQSGSAQSPFFMESSNVNTAYTQALTIVNLDALRPATADPTAPQVIVDKINNSHNCGDAGACTALANNVLTYITNWAIGGAATSGAESNNTVVLTPPAIRSVGTSRSFPTGIDRATTQGTNGSSFANTIWPLLTTNCSGCHQESSPTPQAPFFAEEDDVEAAYDAVISGQKINLDDPAVSRLVVRLNPELHNCWDPNSTGGADCPASATAMLAQIILFRDGIPLTQINPDWQVSRELDLTDGILASGGGRDDSSTIALYEMKTGNGSVLYDTSGVEPALNLNLYSGYSWVGGWGIEFTGGRAQSSARNSKIRDHIISSGEYSIEAWVVPASVSQGDADEPARIISYSGGEDARNFSLGQADYTYSFLNRNQDTTAAEGVDALITDDMDEDLQASQQHVVATYDPINGRKIYVNGIDVSTVGNDAGSTDPVNASSLISWDDSFPLVLGNEHGGDNGDFSWMGKLRLVAIHDRAMTPGQVLTNFEAGVGEKFYLMFSVSHLMDNPDCYLASAITPGNPLGDQCFIYMVVSQFDNYSYLFNAPTFINLNSGSGTTVLNGIRAMRIGLNGKEPAVGQGFSNIGKPVLIEINAAANTSQELSSIGTIIALEKGAGLDEFFLSFEEFGTYTDNDAHANAEYVCDIGDINECLTDPVNGTPVSDIGLRTFDEINAAMAEITGVDRNTTSVKNTFDSIKQQLPPVENIDGFVSANQMAIAQLAIQYCSELVDDTTLRINFFGAGFGFTDDVDTAYDTAGKNQVVDALYDRVVSHRTLGGSEALLNVPTQSQVTTELIGPDSVDPEYPGNLFDRLYNACDADIACNQNATRTRAVTKALCTSVLSSAAMLIQ